MPPHLHQLERAAHQAAALLLQVPDLAKGGLHGQLGGVACVHATAPGAEPVCAGLRAVAGVCYGGRQRAQLPAPAGRPPSTACLQTRLFSAPSRQPPPPPVTATARRPPPR